jgi:hypothetical protein
MSLQARILRAQSLRHCLLPVLSLAIAVLCALIVMLFVGK